MASRRRESAVQLDLAVKPVKHDTGKNLNRVRKVSAPSEDYDQRAHSHSLISLHYLHEGTASLPIQNMPSEDAYHTARMRTLI